MSLTPSNMMPLGTKAPAFTLPDVVSGDDTSFSDVKGKHGTVVMFICAHCPFVKHVEDELASIADTYSEKGVGFVAISANDVDNYPADAPDKLAEQAESVGFDFPYLYDESQDVAKAYDAACTPDFFVFDDNDGLFYRGQLDETRPNQGSPDGEDLREALDALIAGEDAPADQKPSVGCNIKWK